MWAVAEGFEEIFLNILMKSMQSSDFAEDGILEPSHQEQAIKEMYHEELARVMSQRHDGLGIARMIHDYLERGAGGSGVAGDAPGDAAGPVSAKRPLVRPAVHAPTDTAARAVPVSGAVSSPFGMRHHPITDRTQKHEGLDIAAAEGSPIRAFRDGVVEYAGRAEGYGNIVVVRHADGMKTLYGHNRENLVATGDAVRAGDLIARVGSTGRSTGPHLHFEIVREGERVDPLPYLKKKPIPGNRGPT
jgi:murein DD-endopeptidase MepM/ murein hydrolase activator NlpD